MPVVVAGRPGMAAVAVAVFLGGAILYLALPRAVAAALLLPHKSTVSQVRQGRVPSADRLEAAIEAQRGALDWLGSGSLALDQAYLRLVGRARGVSSAKDRSTEYAEIEKLLSDGLRVSPVNADGWRWLANIRLDFRTDRTAAANALRMSQYTGPFVRYLIVPRIRLAFQLWDRLDESDRLLAYRQIRFAWRRISDKAVVALAVESSNPYPIRIALAANPQDLVEFDQMLREHRKSK